VPVQCCTSSFPNVLPCFKPTFTRRTSGDFLGIFSVCKCSVRLNTIHTLSKHSPFPIFSLFSILFLLSGLNTFIFCPKPLLYMLLYFTMCYCMLLFVTICYCVLLYVAVCYCVLLYVAYVTACYCVLLYVVVCYCVLLCVTVCYYVLLYVACVTTCYSMLLCYCVLLYVTYVTVCYCMRSN